jgi:hypothetical protein
MPNIKPTINLNDPPDPSKASHFLIHDENGKVVGNGFTPDGTFMPGTIKCEPHHKEHWDLCEVVDGVIYGPTPQQMMERAAQKAYDEKHMSAVNSGLNVASLSHPEINGTYSVDQGTLQRLSGVNQYIQTHSAFPGSSGDKLAWPDSNQAYKVFTSFEVFGAFAKALHDYAMDLELYKAKAVSDLPSPNVIIA